MKQIALSGLLILACTMVWANENTRHELTVYKSPWCGCCADWASYMKDNGFSVIQIDVEDINIYKQRYGIPYELSSCHTALVDGYVIEGHVPVADVWSLLRERPDIIGLTVPGMPIGSPGMEQGSLVQAYDVLAIRRDGTVYTYNHYEGRE